MPKLLDDPKIRQLLDQADAAAGVHRDPGALASIHLELGRTIHDWVSRSRSMARLAAGPAVSSALDLSGARDLAVGRDTLDGITDDVEPKLADVDDDGWFTDEMEVMPDRPLFEASDLDDHTEFPTENADSDVATLDQVHAWGRDGRTALGRGAPLGELREILALADHPGSSDGLAVEASRLQWATSDLEGRLGGLPRDVQIALVGLLAARAQHLQERLGSGVGPSLALDRLRRWQAARGLPTVAGLETNALPERGGWIEDAAAWWDVLDLPAQ